MFEAIKSKLNELVVDLKNSEQQAQVLASTTALGLVSKRAFNFKTGSKNAKDENLGAYTDAYRIKKEKISKKDESHVNLYNTGTLYGSLRQVKKGKETYVAVTDVKYPLIPSKTITRKDGTTRQTKGGGGESTVAVSDYLDTMYDTVFQTAESEIKIITKVVEDWLIDKANESISQ